MVNVANVMRSIKSQPGYTAMRGFARFPFLRTFVANTRGAFTYRAFQPFLHDCENRMNQSVFQNIDKADFVTELQRDGVAFGLTLPANLVADIRRYADEALVYADRNPKLGFLYSDREAAEEKIGKPVLVAQYYNTVKDCPSIAKLVEDPFLQWVAAMYIGSIPTFVGSNLWWTSPVVASAEDRSKHAHVYHRDVDDFRFFKFFFYITDVHDGEGAHICVRASHSNPPVVKSGDKWNIRRYTDVEVESYYRPDDILEITGAAGTGFAEDTLCIHKGSTPKTEPRLLLQIQFAMFDYGVMHDRKAPSDLKAI